MKQFGSFNPQLLKDHSDQELIPIIKEWGAQIAKNGVMNEFRYKILKFVALRQENADMNPSKELLSLVKSISQAINTQDPQIKDTKFSFPKYKANLNILYRSCYHEKVSQLINQAESQISEQSILDLFQGVLLNCQILALLSEQELQFILNLLSKNNVLIDTSKLMNLALELSSLHSLKPIPVEIVFKLVKEFIERARKEEISKDQLLQAFKLMLKIKRNLQLLEMTQEISASFSELLNEKIPQTEQNMMQILSIEHQFKSSIYQVPLEYLKKILLSMTNSIGSLNIFFYKSAALLDDPQVLKVVSKLWNDYKYPAQDQALNHLRELTNLLSTINQSGLHKQVGAERLIKSLFKKFIIDKELLPILEQLFIFRRLSFIQGEVKQENSISMLLYEQYNNKNKVLILKFIDELIRASFITEVINPKKTTSIQFKSVEFLSQYFMKMTYNKEDQIQFQVNLAYILVAYHNYLSPIWGKFLGSLIATYQLKNNEVKRKLYLIFRALEHYLRTEFDFFISKFNRQVKQNIASINPSFESLPQEKRNMIEEVKKMLTEKEIEFFQNYMAQSQVDFFIPGRNVAILIDSEWSGEGLNLDQRVLEEVLRHQKIKLVVLFTKRESKSQMDEFKVILEK